MNNNNILCGCYGLFPSYVARILNSVKDINFYVLCNKILNYADYIEKCISGRKCTISLTGNYFQLTSSEEESLISFEAKIVHEKLPSELTVC